MQRRRQRQRAVELTNGPAKLCEALQVDRSFDGWDLTQGERLWIADSGDPKVSTAEIGQSVRIGVTSAEDLALRFYHKGNPFVSGPKRLRC
jgi:DNA-3-methyladenine glycosylase